MDPVEDESVPLVGRGREDSVRSGSITPPRIQLHLYFLPSTKNAITIDLQFGPITAENICIEAAKKCGNMKPPCLIQSSLSSIAVNPSFSWVFVCLSFSVFVHFCASKRK